MYPGFFRLLALRGELFDCRKEEYTDCSKNLANATERYKYSPNKICKILLGLKVWAHLSLVTLFIH